MPQNTRPSGTNLGNWRTSPYNRWAFQNVRELIPTANISAAETSRNISNSTQSNAPSTKSGDLVAQLTALETDSLVMLKDGKKRWQWSAPHCDPTKPHIIFSVSKSITALLAGCLCGQKLLDTNKAISHYLENTKDSGYGDCTVQQLLDMQVSLNFIEDYTDPRGDYFRYRNATGWNPVDQTNQQTSLETFLYSLQKGDIPHGETFAYKSPNSDLLGLLIERVAGISYAELLSSLIWTPMGAKQDAYVTVDNHFLARGAGGICTTIDDLARLGQLVLDHGAIGSTSIIPENWIHDTFNNGNQHAWLHGDFASLLPKGNYRNKCYQVGDKDRCLMGIGIHGQWLFINPTTQVVIAQLSSRADPLNEEQDIQGLQLLIEMSQT